MIVNYGVVILNFVMKRMYSLKKCFLVYKFIYENEKESCCFNDINDK